MKANPAPEVLRPLLLALALATAAHAQQVAPAAALSLRHHPTNHTAVVHVDNPGNQRWKLEYSEDLTRWTELADLRVFNGAMDCAVPPPAGAPRRFYRTVHDPSWAALPSGVNEALSLAVPVLPYASPTLPATFSVQPILGQDNTPGNNPTTNAGAELGRVLFYDKRLSANQTLSCASCHQREHGFSDPRTFSVGFAGGLTGRNSMGLAHARWYQRRAFFWDERAATLEAQVLEPIQNSVEMGMTLTGVVARVSAEPFYATLFTRAFGDATVTSDRLSRALAQFVRSIVSTQSKYDVGAASNFSNFTAQEVLGRQIFLGQVGNATCAACHGTDNFVPGPNINNNGLENPYVDKGVGALTGRAQDEGLFKVPSLRNIGLTAPYMHDGRFQTLEQVVEFYNSGVVNHPNLSPPLRAPGGPGQPVTPRRLNLTAAQKAALVAFLHTLTDPHLATDPKYADPFRYADSYTP
jgi:cytochrome c peroxidase